MARGTGLSGSRPRRLAAMGLAVLLLHLAGLEWLARHRPQTTALQQMAEPLFTRLLVPQTPPPPPPAPPAAVAARPPAPTRPTLTAVPTPSVPASASETVALSAPEPAAPVDAPIAEPPEEPPSLVQDPQAEAVASAPEPEPGAEPVPELMATDPAAPEPEPEPAAVASAPGIDPMPLPAETTAAAPTDAPSLDSWPRDSRLSYSLSGMFRSGQLYGSAQVQWQREGSAYQARITLDISLAGTRVMTSQGEVRPEGLVPHVYEERRRGKSRTVRIEGDRLVFGDGQTAPRPPDVQDTASQFVELGHRFASGREVLKVGRSIEVWLARPSGADLWIYDVVAEELLKTPHHGEVAAFRLKPRPLTKARGNITAEIWFAPTLQYLPVRIRVTMGDEAFVDLMVETIEQR